MALLAGFIRMQRAMQRRGGTPLIDLDLLSDRVFLSGMGATFCFFVANLSFYFVLTLFMQNAPGLVALRRGVDTCMPLALAFVAGSRPQRLSGGRR